MFGFDGLGLREVLVPLRHAHAVEPNAFRFARVVKEQDVGGDGCIGGEDALRHTDDCMKVHVFQQSAFDLDLRGILAEKESVGDDDRNTAVFLEAVENQR